MPGRPRHRAGLAAVALAAVAAAAAAGAGLAAAADIVPHKAFYTLKLKRTSPGNTLADATGSMYVDWVDACDGWSSSQRLQLRLYDSAKPAVEIISRFASWESRDGLSFRFSLASTENGIPDKQFSGEASLEAPGLPGRAEFTGRDAAKLDLPAGTVFPLRHMLDLIDGAAAGDKIVSRTVFDGTTTEGPFEINAVIAHKRKAAPEEPAIPKEMDQSYWRMRLAFFKLGNEETTPFYEMSVDLLDNGIARDMELDYGDSVIGAKLERIEVLNRPKC